MAKELGFYADRGLDVEMLKQASWPATRDNLLSGEIDGAHCLSTMPYSVASGISGSGTGLKIAMILNNNGQAITLNKDLAARRYGDLGAAKEVLESRDTDVGDDLSRRDARPLAPVLAAGHEGQGERRSRSSRSRRRRWCRT